MKLSVKSDYAARAVLGLAKHYASGKAVRIEDLAREQHIPHNYLVQILIELKSRQIVQSQRGKEGGYRLARAPEGIHLGEVLACIHGAVFDTPALSDPECPSALKGAWQQLREAMEREAGAIDFRALMEKEARDEEMYYI